MRAIKEKMKPGLRTLGLKRCKACGAYSELHYVTCGRCRADAFEHPWNDEPEFSEPCPTCDNKRRPSDDCCPLCRDIWQASPPPKDLAEQA